MEKILVFDMDGTIADLYGVENWLPMLRAEDSTPYAIAKPLYDMDVLNTIIESLRMLGWKIAVTTWGAKNASFSYDRTVAAIKKSWLESYDFPFDYFFFQKYGTSKNEATEDFSGRQILIDDNEDVRNHWNGETIDARLDIIESLIKLLETEV